MKKSLSISLIIILIIGAILTGMPSNVYAASISSSQTVTVGDKVSVTVNMGRAVSAASFQLSFNSSILTYNGANRGECNPSGGSGKYGYYGNNDDLSSVTFTFTANSEGTSNVTIGGISAKWGELEKPESISAGMSSSITVKAKATPTPEPTATPTPKPTENPSNPNTTEPPTPTATSTPEEPNRPDENQNDNNQEPDNQEPENPEEDNEDDNKQDENNENNNQDNDNETAPDEIIKIDREEGIITVKNEENDIMVKGINIAIKENDVILDVQKIDENSKKMKKLEDIMKKVKGNKKYYDIKLLKDNEIIQPNGYVTVYIPIPEEYNKDKLELYFINEETKKFEKKNGEIQGNYYTFTTNHFSIYSLVEKTEEENQGMSITNIIFMILAGVLLVAIVAILIQRNKKEDI